MNNSGLSVKNTKGIVVGSISNTGAITGTGLTIKKWYWYYISKFK